MARTKSSVRIARMNEESRRRWLKHMIQVLTMLVLVLEQQVIVLSNMSLLLSMELGRHGHGEDTAVMRLENSLQWMREHKTERKQGLEHFGKFDNHLRPDGSYSAECGISNGLFLELVGVIAENLAVQDKRKRKRPRFLCLEASVALTLVFMKSTPHTRKLAKAHGLAPTVVNNTVRWMIIHIRVAAQKMSPWLNKYDQMVPAGIYATIGAVDACAHQRERPLIDQAALYRGDKGYHFLSALVVVDHLGFIVHLAIARGHNNDQGLYKLFLAHQYLRERAAKLLADGGFHDPDNLVRPTKLKHLKGRTKIARHMREFHQRQTSERVPIEHLFGRNKMKWELAKDKNVLMDQYLHAFALTSTYLLTQLEHRPNVDKICQKIHRPMALL